LPLDAGARGTPDDLEKAVDSLLLVEAAQIERAKLAAFKGEVAGARNFGTDLVFEHVSGAVRYKNELVLRYSHAVQPARHPVRAGGDKIVGVLISGREEGRSERPARCRLLHDVFITNGDDTPSSQLACDAVEVDRVLVHHDVEPCEE